MPTSSEFLGCGVRLLSGMDLACVAPSQLRVNMFSDLEAQKYRTYLYLLNTDQKNRAENYNLVPKDWVVLKSGIQTYVYLRNGGSFPLHAVLLKLGSTKIAEWGNSNHSYALNHLYLLKMTPDLKKQYLSILDEIGFPK